MKKEKHKSGYSCIILLMQKFKTSGKCLCSVPLKRSLFWPDHRYSRGNCQFRFPQISQEWTKIQDCSNITLTREGCGLLSILWTGGTKQLAINIMATLTNFWYNSEVLGQFWNARICMVFKAYHFVGEKITCSK